jgi:hypothetical protein
MADQRRIIASVHAPNVDIGHPKLFIVGEDSVAKFIAGAGCE